MKRVIVPLAEGFEELEAVAIIDILRRAGTDVTVAALEGSVVTGSHGIAITCDAPLDACDPAAADAVVLPGGLPGTRHLAASEAVATLASEVYRRGGLVAAICAAPTVLDGLGLLEGKAATSHPAHADEMTRCLYNEAPVVVSGNIVTSRGAGTAVDFAAELVAILVGRPAADDILSRIVAPERTGR